MALPTTFRKARERIVSSYDTVDIATGKGYQILYAGDLTGRKILSSSKFNADQGMSQSSGSTITSPGTSQQIIVFDMDFEKPAIVEGSSWVSVPMAVKWLDGAGAGRIYYDYVAKAIHFDGTKETELVSSTCKEFKEDTLGTAGQVTEGTGAVELDVPKTKFKKGETLRLKIDQRGANAGGARMIFAVGHDPNDSEKSEANTSGIPLVFSGTTLMTWTVPFKIDL